eukprot:360484-Chlamydomonas_euryale.AAC.12
MHEQKGGTRCGAVAAVAAAQPHLQVGLNVDGRAWHEQQVARQLLGVRLLRRLVDLDVAVKHTAPGRVRDDALVQLLRLAARVVERQLCVQVVQLALARDDKVAHRAVRLRAKLRHSDVVARERAAHARLGQRWPPPARPAAAGAGAGATAAQNSSTSSHAESSPATSSSRGAEPESCAAPRPPLDAYTTCSGAGSRAPSGTTTTSASRAAAPLSSANGPPCAAASSPSRAAIGGGALATGPTYTSVGMPDRSLISGRSTPSSTTAKLVSAPAIASPRSAAASGAAAPGAGAGATSADVSAERSVKR